MFIPLYEPLNTVVGMMYRRHFPEGVDITDVPQDNYEDMRHKFNMTGRLRIWSGASENTIFGHKAINWQFRAWHDYWHIVLDQPFTYEGELTVLQAQMNEAEWFMRSIGWDRHIRDTVLSLLICEIQGQLEYQEKHGEFPPNQRAFAREWMRKHTKDGELKLVKPECQETYPAMDKQIPICGRH